MFHNVLMTTVTPSVHHLHYTNENDCWENRPFAKETRNTQLRSNDSNISRTIRKKKKRNRTSYTTEQLRELERWFTRSRYLDRDHRRELSQALGIGEKCIKIWFQNRRMKEKKESSDSSSDSSSVGVDSASPLPSILTEAIANTIPEESMNNEICYKISTNIDASGTNAQYTNHQSASNQYIDNSYPVLSSFNNDNNIYPTQYYPYYNNAYNYNSGQNQYYGYQWPEASYNLSYL